MANFLAWSYSRIKQFKTCPRQLWHSVAPRGHPDRIAYVETQAMRDGKEIDEALTKRIGENVPLPAKYAAFEPMARAVIDTPGSKFTQMQLALDQAFNPCGYMDWDNAWVRAIYDVAVIDKDYAFLGDWKNGQVTVDEDQLRLFAIVGFHTFPEVETIDTSYIWLKHGFTSDKTYERRYLGDLWQTFIPDVERMQVSHQTGQWPTTPSKTGCKWCPANKDKRCKDAAVAYGKSS